MKESALQALLRPETYGKDVKTVRLIQTHTSWVFLTGRFAYKIKKPVFFGFLDYTTLEARKFFCEEELRLNRRLSPELYFDVIPITEEQGKISLNRKGKVIDYAVKMKELPQESLMTELLKQNKISYPTIDKIAKIVADFHNQLPTDSKISQFGRIETIKFNWDENFVQTEEFIGKTISRQSFELIKKAVSKYTIEHLANFNRRIKLGKIKQCHGDLHSKNIFITDKIYIFDGIEFNLRFSCCDTASEIGFFVMDLDYYGKQNLANFFVDRYLQYTQDYEMLALLDFYKCYRAYVRGKVTSFNLNDKNISEEEKAVAKKTAQRYFQLALHYAKNLFGTPKLIAMIGLPGVGKTHFAKAIAKKINGYHLRTDIIRKELMNLPREKHYYTGYGSGIYQQAISEKTYDELYRRTRIYLKYGKTCILDATFAKFSARRSVRKIAKEFNVPLLFVECYCPDKIVFKRLAKRARDFDFSDANLEVYKAMKKDFDRVRRAKNVIKVNTARPLRRIYKQIKDRLETFAKTYQK